MNLLTHGRRGRDVPGSARRWQIAGAALILVGIAAAVPTAALAAGPAALDGIDPHPGGTGRIVLVRHGDLYTVEPDGSRLIRLTHDGHDAWPRWSPLGTEIAYLHRGRLWLMNADGSHAHALVSRWNELDSRPAWSPDGRRLAYVARTRTASRGLLTRYDLDTGTAARFTASIGSSESVLPSLPGPVDWASARDGQGTRFDSLVFEGAGALCAVHRYCLVRLDLAGRDLLGGGSLSSEDVTASPVRLVDPDWYPVSPFAPAQALTTVLRCGTSGCRHVGLSMEITDPPILPGAYQAVYAPDGARFAFVRARGRTPWIWVTVNVAGQEASKAFAVTAGQQPDW